MRDRGRSKLDSRVTIADLARMHDRRNAGKAPAKRYVKGALPVGRGSPVKHFTVNQGDTRLSRLKARASGIRYALQTEALDPSKTRELEQILKNLELAIRGMEQTLKAD